jgi:hypothetical protein
MLCNGQTLNIFLLSKIGILNLQGCKQMRLFQDLNSIDINIVGKVLKYYRMNDSEILDSIESDFPIGGKKMKSRKNKRKTRNITKQNKPKGTRR